MKNDAANYNVIRNAQRKVSIYRVRYYRDVKGGMKVRMYVYGGDMLFKEGKIAKRLPNCFYVKFEGEKKSTKFESSLNLDTFGMFEIVEIVESFE